RHRHRLFLPYTTLFRSRRPFTPLRLHLADGRVREIRHPEMAVVSETDVVIGVPRDDKAKVAMKFNYCSIPNIVEIEPFDLGEPQDRKSTRLNSSHVSRS